MFFSLDRLRIVCFDAWAVCLKSFFEKKLRTMDERTIKTNGVWNSGFSQKFPLLTPEKINLLHGTSGLSEAHEMHTLEARTAIGSLHSRRLSLRKHLDLHWST
jgi:hypothetical protein